MEQQGMGQENMEQGGLGEEKMGQQRTSQMWTSQQVTSRQGMSRQGMSRQRVSQERTSTGIRIALALFTVFLLFPASARAVTGFLKSEELSGMSKICYYEVFGELRSYNIRATELCPLSRDFDIRPSRPAPQNQRSSSGGSLGFLKSELKQGMSKICYYEVLGQRKVPRWRFVL